MTTSSGLPFEFPSDEALGKLASELYGRLATGDRSFSGLGETLTLPEAPSSSTVAFPTESELVPASYVPPRGPSPSDTPYFLAESVAWKSQVPNSGVDVLDPASEAVLGPVSGLAADAFRSQPNLGLPVGLENDAFAYTYRTVAPPGLTLGGLPSPFSFELFSAPSPQEIEKFTDIDAIRADFPILGQKINGRRLIWLDSAATTQKPRQVIDRLVRFYETENSNIHRAAHTLAASATDAYEAARTTAARYLGASSPEEIVFVRGATEGVNLVSQSWGRQNVRKGDEILITHLEHHANIVPWQQLCAETGAHLRVVPVDGNGDLILSEYRRLLGPATKIVAFTHVSNALGTVTPAEEIIATAHRYGAKVLLDAAQSVAHMPIDVAALGCDWLVLSGHKIYGPTGIGVLYGRKEVLQETQPWQSGGNMIADVTFEKTRFQEPPLRFEAGTGNIADAIGLAAAFDYLDRLGRVEVHRREDDLIGYAVQELKRVPGLKLIGNPEKRAGALSFVIPGFETGEIGKYLDQDGIAVRAGHHCAQPILRRFGLESTVRPSFGVYNDCDDVDALVDSLLHLVSGNPRLGI